MEMFKDLFKFPIVLIDGENEERKRKEGELFSREEQAEYDIITGYAEFPYYDFRGMEDRWMPSEESLERAMKGKFDACLVNFLHASSQLVPWTKEKFKQEIGKFMEEREKDIEEEEKKIGSKVTAIPLSDEQAKKLIEIFNSKSEKDGNTMEE